MPTVSLGSSPNCSGLSPSLPHPLPRGPHSGTGPGHPLSCLLDSLSEITPPPRSRLVQVPFVAFSDLTSTCQSAPRRGEGRHTMAVGNAAPAPPACTPHGPARAPSNSFIFMEPCSGGPIRGVTFLSRNVLSGTFANFLSADKLRPCVRPLRSLQSRGSRFVPAAVTKPVGRPTGHRRWLLAALEAHVQAAGPGGLGAGGLSPRLVDGRGLPGGRGRDSLGSLFPGAPTPLPPS